MNQIAKRLQEVREEKGYSIEEVSKRSGLAMDVLEAFESGEKQPEVSALMQLSKAYEMSIDRIIYTNQELPKYNEASAVYANVKPSATPDSKACKEAQKETVSQYVPEKKAGLLSHLVFPVLCVVIYIFLGVVGGFWHPGWMIFLGIPLYYGMVFITTRIGRGVDSAVQEYVDEEKKRSENSN